MDFVSYLVFVEQLVVCLLPRAWLPLSWDFMGDLEMSEKSAKVGEKSGKKTRYQGKVRSLCSQGNLIVAAQ